MLKKLQKRNQSGFTIIEVLIVLAIAGLILLIVFLAVPALQRSQRNTSRKNDAARVSAAVTSFVSNNNGTLPATTGDLQTLFNDAGTLGQYSSISTYSTTPPAASGAATTNTFYISTAGVTYVAPTATGNTFILDEQQTCGNASGTTAAGTSRQAALLYTVEPNSGNWTWVCIQAQG